MSSGKIIPPGKLISVAGKNMHIYAKGSGSKTVVLMAGSSVTSPVYEYKKVVDSLSAHYQVVVIEKFGYGYSDCTERPRDVSAIVDELRTALHEHIANNQLVLMPHSMAALEALYWVQNYPGEIEAVIGLDPAIPECYDVLNIKGSLKLIKVLDFLRRSKLIRILPVCRLASKNLDLSPGDFVQFKLLLYRNFANEVIKNEGKSILSNVDIVKHGVKPNSTPMLFFISNAKGTRIKKDIWRGILIQYIKSIHKSQYHCLEHGHSSFYRKDDHFISERTKEFLDGLCTV